MRVEPPVSRLAAITPPRRRLLPIAGGAAAAGGWVPPPDWAPTAGPRPLTTGLRPAGETERESPGETSPAAGGSVAMTTIREGLADRLPVRWRQVGRAVPRRAALAAAAVAGVLVLGLLAHQQSAGPSGFTVATTATTDARTGPTGGAGPLATPRPGTAGVAPSAVGSVPAGAPASPDGELVIDVEGRVHRPGLVRVAAGSRVADAVRAAGGASSGAALIRVNLARPLTDGEQIVIPGPHDPVAGGAAAAGSAGSAGPGAGTGAGSGADAVLDLNSATASQLDALPGIGPVLAGRIVEWRTAHGRFASVDELGEVSGIGDAVLARLRPRVRV